MIEGFMDHRLRETVETLSFFRGNDLDIKLAV